MHVVMLTSGSTVGVHVAAIIVVVAVIHVAVVMMKVLPIMVYPAIRANPAPVVVVMDGSDGRGGFT